jgi:hypothetical protein
MPKRRTTCRTFWRATPSTGRSRLNSALLSLVALLAFTAQSAPHPSLKQILDDHLAALSAMHLHEPHTQQIIGTVDGLGTTGAFHEWQEGEKQRRDERLGFRTRRILRVGDRMWIENASGEIRELEGIGARRQITSDFVDSGDFAREPQYVRFLQTKTLPDGRTVYELRVSPPHGTPYVVGVDATTFLIDETSYADHDGFETSYYSDYHAKDGVLVPYTEVDTNGDRSFDVTSHVTSVVVNAPIAPSVFAPLTPVVVQNAVPVSVPVLIERGLIFATVTIEGKPYHFLVDTGSQGDVIDAQTAKALGLHPQGTLEITGAKRVASEGLVETPDLVIGGVTLPSHIASVVDLGGVPAGIGHVDGVLGYPFFAAAEVRIDPDTDMMTIAMPGTLPPAGSTLPVDTDRELPEIHVSIDGTDARVVVDTGDTREVLIFRSFLDHHPQVISWLGGTPVRNYGVGGVTDAIEARVADLRIGSFDLYNRYANVVLTARGAFADRTDEGNVGEGVLQNFIVTFDLPDHVMQLAKAKRFDDGRGRPLVNAADQIPQ